MGRWLAAAVATSGGVLGGGQNPDPAVQDFPVAYVKRPLLRDDMGALETQRRSRSHRNSCPAQNSSFAIARRRARLKRSITAGVFPNDAMGNPPLYDVKDLSSSFDGKQLAFAMRAPEDSECGRR